MKASNLANHIINYCLSINNPVSNLQLQKILYFIEIYHIIRTDECLIEDEHFKALKFGPVLESIYKKYSYFASNPINIFQDGTTEEFEDNIKGELYGYIEKLSKMYPSFLVDKSRECGGPWHKTKMGDDIQTELLKGYAKNLRGSNGINYKSNLAYESYYKKLENVETFEKLTHITPNEMTLGDIILKKLNEKIADTNFGVDLLVKLEEKKIHLEYYFIPRISRNISQTPYTEFVFEIDYGFIIYVGFVREKFIICENEYNKMNEIIDFMKNIFKRN